MCVRVSGCVGVCLHAHAHTCQLGKLTKQNVGSRKKFRQEILEIHWKKKKQYLEQAVLEKLNSQV